MWNRVSEEESLPLPISDRIGEGVPGTLDFSKYFDKKFNMGGRTGTSGPREIIHDRSYLRSSRFPCILISDP